MTGQVKRKSYTVHTWETPAVHVERSGSMFSVVVMGAQGFCFNGTEDQLKALLDVLPFVLNDGAEKPRLLVMPRQQDQRVCA